MANVNGPMGLVPSRVLGGGCVTMNPYSIASEYATAIYAGDPVEMTGTGKQIALAAAGTVNAIGVFAGVRYIDSQGRPQFSKFWPAGTVATEIEALVYDDPNIIFRAQADTLAEADVGALADWVAGSGNPTTGRSGAEVEGSLVAAVGKSLRVIGLLPEVGNAYGAYAKVEVMFAEHALKGVVAGVGGD